MTRRLLSAGISAAALSATLLLAGCGSSGDVGSDSAPAGGSDAASDSQASSGSSSAQWSHPTQPTQAPDPLMTACIVLRDEIQALYDGYAVAGATADDETARYQAIASELDSALAGLGPADQEVMRGVVGAAGDRGSVGPEPTDASDGLDWALANLELVIEFGRAVEKAEKLCASVNVALPVD